MMEGMRRGRGMGQGQPAPQLAKVADQATRNPTGDAEGEKMAAEKIEFARARAQDVARLGELSDSVFRPQLIPGTGMPKEFPLAFSAENAHNLYFAAVDGRPVSLVALYPSRLVVPGGHVSAVSMGSVCTLPEFREQHLASQLIHQILTDFSPHTSLLLVSGGRGLYRRLGCVDFGERVEADVALAGLPAGDTEWVVNPVPEPEAEVAALSRLYAAEPYRYERSEAEFRMLLRSLRTPLFRGAHAEQGGPQGTKEHAEFRFRTLVAVGLGSVLP